MLIYPKLTVGVRHMLMHLSLGHVTLPQKEFHPMYFFQSDMGAGRTHVGVCLKFLVKPVMPLRFVIHFFNYCSVLTVIKMKIGYGKCLGLGTCYFSLLLLSLVRPKTIAFGRAYVLLAFILLFSPCVIFELRRLIATKFCTVLGTVFSFTIPVQNFGGVSPKNFRGQNVQNLARFRSTSKFDGEYLRNG